MDPVTIALVGGALGGAGGKAVETLWQATGQRWLERYFDRFSTEARVAGQVNTVEFLSKLAVRIGELEAHLPHDSAATLEEPLRDPDFLITFNSALLASARSSDRMKHDLLARAIVERLTSKADSVQALAATLACEVVPRLTPTQLRTLALLAAVLVIRPVDCPLNLHFGDSALSATQKADLLAYAHWLQRSIMPLTKIDTLNIDFTHLIATGCICRLSGSRLPSLLMPWSDRVRLSSADMNFVTQQLRASVEFIFDDAAAFEDISMSPLGILIGVTTYDCLHGVETAIDWSRGVGRVQL